MASVLVCQPRVAVPSSLVVVRRAASALPCSIGFENDKVRLRDLPYIQERKAFRHAEHYTHSDTEREAARPRWSCCFYSGKEIGKRSLAQ